jgi:hypothetical protein
LSSDWLQVTVIVVPVVPTTMKLPGVVGACVSAGGAHAAVVVVIDVFADRLPGRVDGVDGERVAVPHARPETVYVVEVALPATVEPL